MTAVINDVSSSEFIFEISHVYDTMDEKTEKCLLVGCRYRCLVHAHCWHGTAWDLGATQNQNTWKEKKSIKTDLNAAT